MSVSGTDAIVAVNGQTLTLAHGVTGNQDIWLVDLDNGNVVYKPAGFDFRFSNEGEPTFEVLVHASFRNQLRPTDRPSER